MGFKGENMKQKILIAFILTCAWVAGCGNVETTTASEPQFKSISTEKATTADAELYTALSALEPIPASRIDLAIAIENLDPSTLPIPPKQPLATYRIGDTRTFWTHNSDTFEFTHITARLMAISKHAYFWQDVACQPLNASGKPVTEEDWAAAGESFDISYERVRAVFGQEESPGLDGDPRLFVVHSDSLGKVGGYFGQTDLLPSAIEPHSNEGQYFFISNTWSSGIASDYYKEVLAHEFQHMIHKNVDANEEGWMNEGMSMLAQQVAGMRGYNSVADYLIKPDQSLWYWSSSSQDYGQAYLYIDYLYEQMGQDFIQALVADPRNGLASVDEMLAKFASPRSADDFYADAITAAFFNDPKLASGQYGYKDAVLPTVLPRYEFSSLPAMYQGTVEQYGGVDIMTFTGGQRATVRFTGDQRVKLIPAEARSGKNFWWSNRYDSTFSTLTREVNLTGVTTATLKYWAWYDIEEDWDYAYLLISTDNGTHWTLLPATSNRETNPNDQNLGHGFSGKSGGGIEAVWIEETADLSAYAGKRILLRFAMQNDLVVNKYGFAVDNISVPEIGWRDDAESGNAGWTPEGFILSHNHVPQIWRVRAVEQRADNTIIVHDIDIVNGIGQLDIDLKGTKRLVIFVIGQTRYTTIPASYRIEVSP
jgi:immune inhibitor A